MIEQGAEPQQMRVEEGRTLQAGVVADDVITQAMASIKRLAEMDEGPDGPFGGDLTRRAAGGDPERADVAQRAPSTTSSARRRRMAG